jgi:F-type H+-transporting ATPase subunit b
MNIKSKFFYLYFVIGYFFSMSLNAEEYKGLPQFDSSKYSQQIFWLIIIFGILFVVINFNIVPQFRRIKNDRHNKISSQIESALKIRKNIEKVDSQILNIKNKVKSQILEIENNAVKKSNELFNKKNLDFLKEKKDTQNDFNQKIESIHSNFNSAKEDNLGQLTELILQKLNIIK